MGGGGVKIIRNLLIFTTNPYEHRNAQKRQFHQQQKNFLFIINVKIFQDPNLVSSMLLASQRSLLGLPGSNQTGRRSGGLKTSLNPEICFISLTHTHMHNSPKHKLRHSFSLSRAKTPYPIFICVFCIALVSFQKSFPCL